jgi:sulfur relay (sulfurtransferase) DsrF/TusC family protein
MLVLKGHENCFKLLAALAKINRVDNCGLRFLAESVLNSVSKAQPTQITGEFVALAGEQT